MDRQILNFTANEQVLTVDEPIRISTNKVNYIEAHFALGTNWSGYDSVRAVWFNDYQTISTVLDSQGVCRVPFEVMKRKGQVKVDLVGSISEGDVLTDRLTSYPVVAVIVDCVAPITGAETSPITPSQFEQYVAIVQALVGSVRDIDRIELNPDYTLTIYYSDGTSDTTSSIRGATGNGIASIAKTGSSGTNPVVDTYTVTYTGGNTFAFTVTNGKKGDTGATGATGPTGNGIQSIYKTGTSGLVDTYTILYTNGNTTTFEITNGQNGSLASTVLASTYSSSKTYAVGDYVYYSGNLYRCTTAITTAEAWTSGHWTQVALADDVSDLKSELNNLYQPLNLNLIANSYWTVSGSPIGAPVAYNGWSRTDRLPCKAGETIKISSTVKSAYNIFFNTDTDGDINQTFTVQVGDNEFKVPSGAHYYALSNTTTGMQNTTVQQIIDGNDVASKREVSEAFDILEIAEIYKDIDFSSAVEGYFISNTGVYSENAAFCLLSGVNLTKGQTIHIKLRGTTTVATLAKSLENNQYEPLLIGQGGSAVSDQEYIATEDMTVAISYSKTYDHSGYIFFDVSNIADASGKVFYCTPTSGFYSALEAIRADDSLGIRTLYVQAGEYDLYDELGGNDYANSCIPDESYIPPNTAWKHFSVVCPDRLKIVGLGDVVLKMNIPNETWAEGAIPNSVLTPLSLRYGCEVENITIKCTDTRYGIHIEGSGEASYRKVQYVFRNVTVEYTYTGEGYNSAIGCGLNANDNLILDNCVLKIIGASGNGIAGHLNDGSSNVFVNNSFINAPTTDFDVKWNTKGKDSRFRFLNTILNKITLSNGNQGQTPFTITYEMVRTDATMKRPSDTSITMPTIVNYGSNLTIEEWT